MKANTRLLLFLRIALAVMVAANLFVIFFFSLQTAEKSSASSGTVTDKVIDVSIKDYDSKDSTEQESIRLRYNTILRRFAHRAEYGTLGALVFLLLLTWKKHTLIKYVGSLLAVFITGSIDEICQVFTDGRSGEFTDVLTDLSGAAVTCTVILIIVGIVMLCKRLKARKKAKELT